MSEEENNGGVSLFKHTPDSTARYQETEKDVMRSLDLIESGAEVNLASPPLTTEEAHVITDRIRSASETLYVLIHKAHAGKAWEAMGYSDFEEYVREEFDISRSRAYRLLAQANVIKEIEEVAPPGSVITLRESDAKVIKDMLSEVIPEIREQTQDTENTEETNRIIQEILNNAKEEHSKKEAENKKEASKATHIFSGNELTESEKETEVDDDFFQSEEIMQVDQDAKPIDDYDYISDEYIEELMGTAPLPSEGKRSMPPQKGTSESEDNSSPENKGETHSEGFMDDRILDMYEGEDSEYFPEEEDGEEEDDKAQDFEHSYILTTALTNLNTLPEPQKLASIIPDGNKEAMKALIPKIRKWLEEFEELCE